MGLFGNGDGLGPFTGFLFGRALEKSLKKKEKKELKRLQKQAALNKHLTPKDTEDHSWRARCEDGSKYSLDPKDFDTKTEYDEALFDEKYYWRDAYKDDEDVIKYHLNINDYGTEDELLDALNSKEIEDDELNGWRDLYRNDPDVIKYGLDPDDYKTEDELCDAIDAMWEKDDEE